MPSIALFGRLHRKANCAAIAMRGRLAIQRLGDAKGAGGRAIEQVWVAQFVSFFG